MIEKKNKWYICHTQFGLCDVGFKVKYTDYINRNGLRFVDENGMYYPITFEEIERYFTPIDINEKNIKENNMTIEEKAKRYDSAIERAKKVKKGEADAEPGTSICEYIFPELRESEDERIRKWIIDDIRYNMNNEPLNNSEYKKKAERAIAWLEKQGEQKVSYTTLVETGNGGINALVTRELPINSCDNANYCKVEPKFKVGDFIVNDYCFGKVIEITNDAYLLDTEQGIPFSCEHNAHLWSIKDAKDGDVLFHSDSASNGIFIFKELLKCGFSVKIICYCDYDSEDGFCLGEYHTCCWADAKILHPATKEQRDLLFAKMHEAGWEWDEDKKELNRMVAPIFNIGDIIAKKHNSDINKFGQFTITDITDGKYWYNDKIICNVTEQNEWELYEPRQKPIWSDEDERMFQSVLIDCSYCGDFPDYPTKEEQELYDEAMDKTDWLKSIKERMK